ncbi:MAG: hypothetical protein F6K48_35395, partial [Okeania sp. SIO3H1]|nr:hypothetical protein [Okeania sp. SIO3H1]
MKPDAVKIEGLHQPLRIYQVSDTHLQEYDSSDPLLSPAWKANPKPHLSSDNSTLVTTHLERAQAGHADLILFCGDLVHFPSKENRRLLLKLLDTCPIPVWTVPGNHDWFYPGQDGWEELRTKQLPWLSPLFGEPSSHWVRSIGGLRVLGLDNSTYFLTQEQTTFLEAELAKPSPLLLMMHIPL